MPLAVHGDDQRRRSSSLSSVARMLSHYPPHPPPPPGPANNGLRPGASLPYKGYTLMVAGQRSGKTSFLRLLLDTSNISTTATKDQLASVAKFVQGCNGHTAYVRPVSVNIDLDPGNNNGSPQVLALTLIDTPSLDFSDEHSAERALQDIIRQVETRFIEGIDDEWKAHTGDHHIHLCIYFVDPDVIVPPPSCVPGPPAPLLSRPRTNSFSHTDPEPVILEPPVTTNPHIIKKLSVRVNVLPVIARADTLTNDRLLAVKTAIRRDLAEAGIGFGIFDMDIHPQYQHRKDVAEPGHPVKSEIPNGYTSRTNRSSPAQPSPPTSPTTPSHLLLPYALISPESYSHSDGVTRVSPPRHELVQQYTPSPHYPPPSKLVRGKFIRSYRWGSMDVLDPNQCDFMSLRSAIFHHMETLQKYTREYLFEKFRADYLAQHHPSNHHLHTQPNIVPRSQLPLSHSIRAPLNIEASPSHGSAVRHPSLSMSRDGFPPGTDMRPLPISRPLSDGINPSHNNVKVAPRSSKQRTKKITVACNFCRSRKLKCDGGRPGVQSMCQTIQFEDESESDISGEDRSVDENDHSVSPPEMASQPLSRKTSNTDKRPILDGFTQPSAAATPAGPSEPREALLAIAPIVRPKPSIPGGSSASEGRSLFKDNELPHIATLSLPDRSPTAAAITALPLPLIRPASEQQAAQRKRASTMPGRSNRQTTSAGPKVVACNFCRARKTKCDGAHPACSSCARRQLPCDYNHSTGHNGGNKKGARRASVSSKIVLAIGPPSSTLTPTHSPPSSTVAGDSRFSNGTPPDEMGGGEPMDVDLKRKIDDIEVLQTQKRIRVADIDESIP
ncbi:hypothetical protein EDC04DRAFT_2965965 [Pisolithus marmoratus]|nr:hypothetical protein EDC04DRAFT_2965965 [Pisolithus marmoratus]